MTRTNGGSAPGNRRGGQRWRALKRSLMVEVTERCEVEPGAGEEAVDEAGAVRSGDGPAGSRATLSVPRVSGEALGMPGPGDEVAAPAGGHGPPRASPPAR